MNSLSSLWRLLLLTMIVCPHFIDSIKYTNPFYFTGQCTDDFNHCNHVCIPNLDNFRQYYCTCRSGYFIQGDGHTCKKTPSENVERIMEANQDLQQSRPSIAKATHLKTTKVLLSRTKRFTRHKSKTAKPSQPLPKGKCNPTSCKNGGICQTMKSNTKNDFGINCLCRLGFDGPICDRVTSGVRFPKFTSHGYLAFPERILNEEDFRLSIYLKPALLVAGSLVAFKNSASSNNFLLGVESNKFIFRFETRKSRKEISHQTTIMSTDSRWYKIEIDRKENIGRLFVDNVESTFAPIETSKSINERRTQISNKINEGVGSFICDFCLYLGGHAQLLSTVKQNPNLFGYIESTYIGCMRNLMIDDEDVDMRRMPFYGRAVEGLAIEDCSAGLCDSLKCENNGECQVFEDYIPKCQCNLGFTGRFCESGTIIKMPYFNGDSYASYIGLRGTSKSENQIFIRFKPQLDTGILLYQGYSIDKRGDFLSIYLINAYLWVSYDLGSGTVSLKSRRSLSLDEWHTIKFIRIGRKGTLIVDDDDNITGHSPGSQVQLTIKQNLLIGGVDSLDNVSGFLTVKTGFRGCIQMLFIDHQPIHLVSDIEKSRNIENCYNHTCGSVRKVCWKDGECIPDKDDFICSCPLGFIEANCQTKIQISGIRDPSFNGSSFLVYTDDRILKKLSDSRFNLSLLLNLKTSQSNRFLIHATRTSQVNTDHFFSVKINSKSGIDFVLNNGIEVIKSNLLNNLPILSDHTIDLIKDKNEFRFIFNKTFKATVKLKYTSLSTIGFSKLFIGGTDLSTSVMMNMPVQSGIIGCVKYMFLDSREIRVVDANDGRSVSECGSFKS